MIVLEAEMILTLSRFLSVSYGRRRGVKVAFDVR